jgi:uncharacterized SAM-dependent methyltransferase
VVYFPGSTIGNLHPVEAVTFLRRMALLCGPRGAMVIGVDLKKQTDVLEAAYNDRQGVTAAFNLNLLARINRDLQADFSIADFGHRAVYDAGYGRIEMHLVSQKPQTVHVGERQFEFTEGETILTEHSYKYSVAEFARLATAARFRVERTCCDERHLFNIHYLTPL